MVAQDTASLVQNLGPNTEAEARLLATRSLKNAVIGNKTKKALFLGLGVVPTLVEMVQNPATSSPNLVVQAAATLGSISCEFLPGAELVLRSGALDALLEVMHTGNQTVVEAAARSVNIIFTSASKENRLEAIQSWPSMRIDLLVDLVSRNQPDVVESACSILAGCCIRHQDQDRLHEKGATDAAIKVLFSTRHPRVQHCALECISKLIEDNLVVCEKVAHHRKLVPFIINFARDRRPMVRLLSCSVLSSLIKGGFLDTQSDVSDSEAAAIVIPALIKLTDELSTRVEAPLVLGLLVADSEKLQKAACDADALNRIISIIKETPPVDPKLLQSALCALAGLTSAREESRKVVLDAQLLPIIVAALKSNSTMLRTAAALCLRSLSRSVKALRSNLGENSIVEPLLGILQEKETEVQLSALGSLCNLVLEFSPLKDEVVKRGGLSIIVRLSKSTVAETRMNATWSLKNLLYKARPELKTTVMEELTFTGLNDLLNDEDSLVQEHAMTLLRNLACSEKGEQQQIDLEHLLQGMGRARLISAIHEGLESSQLGTAKQAVYLAVNVATGKEKFKSMIAESILLDDLKMLMAHQDHRIREGVIWCLINLVWVESDDPSRAATRARVVRFKAEGFEAELHRLSEDPEPDVRDRATAALTCFENGEQSRIAGGPVPDAEPMQF